MSLPFAEPVLRLLNFEPSFAEQPLEDSADVLVEKNPNASHWTVSFGFSEFSRTSSNVASFLRSSSRISSTWA